MKPKNIPFKTGNYGNLITNIGKILEVGRKQTYQAVNTILLETYWKIGEVIVEYEQAGRERAEYGSGLLKNLSKDLTARYGKGFSEDNLENMRKFYSLYKNSETLSRKLSWSHYCLLISIENPLAREFYSIECDKESWSVRGLDRQVNSMLFERIALSKDKKGVIELSKKGQIIRKAPDIVKDPYVLDFLGLEQLPRYTETQLEEKLITHLEKFLLELGKGFTFVERQKRISLEGEHFFVDLVFYNRILRCFVLIELKLGKLTHKDLGQLQMYVNYFDRDIKGQDENPAVGILLCADKKETIVKYTLPISNKQIFASKYQIYLPNKKELEHKLKEILDSDK